MNAMKDSISLGSPLPTVVDVESAQKNSVKITWQDGTVSMIDLSTIIAQFKIFRPLRNNREIFERVSLGYMGASITWGNDMEIGADTLERLEAIQRPMSPEMFRDFMARHHFTLDAMPSVLGISRRQAAYFSAGNKTIPRTVALACVGYDAVFPQK